MKLLNFQKMRNENVSQPSWSQQQKHQKKEDEEEWEWIFLHILN